MGNFYNPPPPFIGGSQPYGPREAAPALLETVAAAEVPRAGRSVALLATVLSLWASPAPMPFMGGWEPLQARTLPPQLTAVAVNDPSGNSQVMRVVEVATVPPQRPRQMSPALFGAAAAADTVQKPQGVPNSVHAAWQPSDPLPQRAAKLVQGSVAASVDTVGKPRTYPASIWQAWQQPDPLPTLSGKLHPSLTAVAVNDPSGASAVMRIVRLAEPPVPRQRQLNPALLNNPPAAVASVPFTRPWLASVVSSWEAAPGLPQQARQLSPAIPGQSVDAPPRARGAVPHASWVAANPAPQSARALSPGIPGQSVDKPPANYKLPLSWSWDTGFSALTAASGAPSSVDNPPFGAFYSSLNVVPIWWRAPDPLPTLAGKLPPSALAVAVDNPPFNARRLPPASYVADPLPTLSAKLLQPFVATEVNDPSGARVPRIVVRLADPLPTLPPKIAAVFGSVGAPDKVTFSRPWLNTVAQAWVPADPQPTQARKLPPAITAVAVNNPPFNQRRQPHAPAYVPADPLPTLGNKIPQAFVAAPIVYKYPWLSTVLDAWQPGPPAPTQARKLSPSITAVAVNDPPFGSRRQPHAPAYVPADQLPTLAAKLQQPFVAVVNNPPFSIRIAQPWLTAWYEITPPAQKARPLSPAIPGQSVDNPPARRVQPASVATAFEGLPQAGAKLPQAAVAVVYSRTWLASVLQQWEYKVAPPALSAKLSPSLLAVRVDNPPFNQRRQPHAPSYVPPDPLPTLSGKIGPAQPPYLPSLVCASIDIYPAVGGTPSAYAAVGSEDLSAVPAVAGTPEAQPAVSGTPESKDC